MKSDHPAVDSRYLLAEAAIASPNLAFLDIN
jgi:hypothetical protein